MDKDLTPKISAVVMIYNEEFQIRDCLESIKWADEIVICDSFSTDRTVEICREYTDKIYQRKFDNFGNQKSWTLNMPAHEWVLDVEADERYTPELRDEIKERLAKNEGCDGYWIPFENYIFGRKMEGKYWIFKRLKLFKKGKGFWQKREVHPSFIFAGKAGQLKNPLLHYPYPDLRVWYKKFSLYTTLEAKEILKNNTKLKWSDLIKGPMRVFVSFFRFYIIWQGWRDGLSGLTISILASFYNLAINIKYFKNCAYVHRKR